MPRVLIAETQPSIQLALRRVLARAGFEAHTVSTLSEFRDCLDQAPWDAILVAEELQQEAIAAGISLGDRVVQLRSGGEAAPSVHSVDKRRDLERLPALLDTMMRAPAATAAPTSDIVISPVAERPANGRATCRSEAWKQVEERLAIYAQHDLPLLIQGESGTGKEVVARALHEEGPRKGHPFVAIHCGAIPAELLESELFGHAKGSFTGAHRDKPGRFETAGEGTLLLDEIGEMSGALQAKLLRALETREFHRVGGSKPVALRARVLASTHRDLEAMLRDGSFRRDLLHRLRVGHLELPALKDRPEDLQPLCELFLAACRDELRPALRGLDAAAWDRIRRHSWPGNVRELFNVLRRATVLAANGVIGAAQLEAIGEIDRLAESREESWLSATRREIRRREARGERRETVFERLREELAGLENPADEAG